MSTSSRAWLVQPTYDLERAPDWFRRQARAARSSLVNLAPLRYAFVAEEGGPVERIDYGTDRFLGREWQLCRAILREEHRHPLGKQLRLFHPADGSGVGATRLEARAKAISEALERWAYFETSSGPDYALYGYAHANSTKGMAAFPGILGRQARALAVAEAYEYFSIDAWWNGALAHWTVERDGATIVFIEQPGFAGYVALAIRKLGCEHYAAAYGMGSGSTPLAAEVKAQLEASRLQVLLERRDRSDLNQNPILEEEQRVLYLASPDGYGTVLDRLQVEPWRCAPTPRVVYDGPVKGPWNRFAHVWRYALEPLRLTGYTRRFVA